ncbi:MAG TPA: hypothetical protein VJS88_00810 [Chthoniobacterales bacterium]|nr:hypothetical protein [Chthoniobacterales bacterium]
MKKHAAPPATRQIFVLTGEEKRIIAFVLVAFLLGLTTRYYRSTRSTPAVTSAVAQSASAVSDAPAKRAKNKSTSP